MKSSYPSEKFSNAVRGMAVSPSTIQRRVADAYLYDLMHLKSAELPEEIRQKFDELGRRLTSATPVGDEGSVYATTNQMETSEAVELARLIVSMAEVVESDYRNE